jgi:hypothetical protein
LNRVKHCEQILKKSIIIVIILFVLYSPTLNQQYSVSTTSNTTQANDDSVLLEGVDYIWQEINGFCAWAATAVAMRYAGIDVDLHDVFALSGIGFSFAYIKYNDTMLMYPGALYQQLEPTAFMAELYGLNLSVYLSSEITGAAQQQQIWESEGIHTTLLDGQSEAFDLMHEAIDEGYPLIISVDPAWLPAGDYDILREQGLSGGGHAVVIVGYNDAEGVATIIDPGVGSFGDNFGYPEDGRGNYSDITYTALNNAWSNRYFISILLKPDTGQIDDISSKLGPYLRDRLLGVGTSYAPSSSSAYLWQYGEKGFRGLSSDMTQEGLSSYLSVFDGINNEREFKTSALLFIGLGLEAQVTLQYLSYRSAIPRIEKFMPEVDLDEFLSTLELALPHFEALSDNTTLISPGNITSHDSLISNTFTGIAMSYNNSGQLDSALQEYSENLEDISNHLLQIADSWRDAGNILSEEWPTDPLMGYGIPILLLSVAAIAAVFVLIFYIKRSSSQ